jgi:hypothetical protein
VTTVGGSLNRGGGGPKWCQLAPPGSTVFGARTEAYFALLIILRTQAVA